TRTPLTPSLFPYTTLFRSLTRKKDLHRPPRVAKQLVQSRPVAKYEVRALVRGEPAPEADGQGVQVELVRSLGPLRGQLEQPPLRSEEHTSELQSRFDLVCR